MLIATMDTDKQCNNIYILAMLKPLLRIACVGNIKQQNVYAHVYLSRRVLLYGSAVL